MKERPICAIEGCNNPALLLFGGEFLCGNCVSEYDRKCKENQFNKINEMLKK